MIYNVQVLRRLNAGRERRLSSNSATAGLLLSRQILSDRQEGNRLRSAFTRKGLYICCIAIKCKRIGAVIMPCVVILLEYFHLNELNWRFSVHHRNSHNFLFVVVISKIVILKYGFAKFAANAMIL